MRPLLSGLPAPPIEHRHVIDGRILQHDRAERLLMAHHVGEGNVLRGFGDAGDQAGVLLREEALRDDHEEIDREAERREEDAAA